MFARLLCSVWNIGLTPLHVYRSYWTSYGVCYAWLSVSTWEGFCFEFFGSLLCGVFAAIIFDWEIFTQLSIHKRIILSSSVTWLHLRLFSLQLSQLRLFSLSQLSQLPLLLSSASLPQFLPLDTTPRLKICAPAVFL